MAFSLGCLTNAPIHPPAVSQTIGSPACPKCGTIQKSGKASCCAPGGSWFKNCGGSGNTKLGHTWYEGIHVCKARLQSKTAVGQESGAAHQKTKHFSNDSDAINSRTAFPGMVPPHSRGAALVVTSATKAPRSQLHTPTVITVPAHVHIPSDMLANSDAQQSGGSSIIIRGWENLSRHVTHVCMLLIVLF